jgi:hypothetical protein
LSAGRLGDFIAQKEACGVGPADRAELDARIAAAAATALAPGLRNG